MITFSSNACRKRVVKRLGTEMRDCTETATSATVRIDVERVLSGGSVLRGSRQSRKRGTSNGSIALQHPDRLPSVHIIRLPKTHASIVAGGSKDGTSHVPRNAPHLAEGEERG